MLQPHQLTGVVLAGGKSSRFGLNKALSNFRGESFIQNTINTIQPYVQELVVSGYYAEYNKLNVRILKDEYESVGPLGGIYTALNYCKTPWLLVLTCDMPFMDSQIIEHLLNSHSDKLLIGWSCNLGKGVFPLLIAKEVLPDLKLLIENNHLKVKKLLQFEYSKTLLIPDKWSNFFSNINTQEEYKLIIQ